MDDLFDVAHLDVMKLFDVQQQFLFIQRVKGREGCLDRMINVNFIKQSSTAESDDGRGQIDRIAPTKVVTFSRQLYLMVKRITKKIIDIMSPMPAMALERSKISDRNATYALELDPDNYKISRPAIRRGRISA